MTQTRHFPDTPISCQGNLKYALANLCGEIGQAVQRFFQRVAPTL